VQRQYFDEHPFFGGFQETQRNITDVNNETAANDLVSIPPVNAKCRSYEDGGNQVYDMWLSPIAFKEGGYKHPAFARSTQNLLVSACLMSRDGAVSGSFKDVAAYTDTSAVLDSDFNNTNNGVNNMYRFSLYHRQLIYLAMAIENGTLNFTNFTGTKGMQNSAQNFNYRGIRCLDHYGTQNAQKIPGVMVALVSGYMGLSILSPDLSSIIPVVSTSNGWYRPSGASYIKEASAICAGFSDALGCDLELLWLPKAADGAETSYTSFVPNKTYLAISGGINNASYSNLDLHTPTGHTEGLYGFSIRTGATAYCQRYVILE
jgi:hypothetical protein